MTNAFHQIAISKDIWVDKYRFGNEKSIEDTWTRVAHALAKAELPENVFDWQEKFYKALEGFKFIPAGRILCGAGTGRKVTLFNCFVSDTIPDSMDGIFTKLHEAALTMQQGGGIGYDFSTLRPKGATVHGVGSDASGPLSFAEVYDAMCKTIMSAGARRGAQMLVLRCDHPDIEYFVRIKYDPTKLRNFNISVAITDAFMEAVEQDKWWDLVFNGKVYKTIKARPLWDKIIRGAYDCAEPGVIFIDRVNQQNNLGHLELVSASNPCSEQMLPPYGACLLGSVNLAAFVKQPFEDGRLFDKKELRETVSTAIRMLDNVVDVSGYPLKAQEREAKAKRRLGLGVTGLGDTLAMLGLRYDSREALVFAGQVMKDINLTAYASSIKIAKEKGAFPLYSNEYGKRPFIKEVLKDLTFHDEHKNIVDIYVEYGIRNSHCTSVAPTGTISLLAGNVSSGVEPIFDWEYERKVLQPDGSKKTETVTDFAVAKWRAKFGDMSLPPSFVKAHDLTPGAHLAMQAALQPYVDSAISKTVNCPENIPFEEFQGLYRDAYSLGLKCCAAYRPNEITGSVLSTKPTATQKATESVCYEPISPGGEIDVKLNSRPGEIIDKEGSAVKAASDLKEGDFYTIKTKEVNTGEIVPLVPRVKVLDGKTYKIKWPLSPHAYYVTINDDGDGNPFEIFINSKNLESHAWTLALTRMVSAIFRRGGDISFVAEELKAVFDPKGGAWMEGAYVPSLLAAIGNTIEAHIKELPVALDMKATEDRSELVKAINQLSDLATTNFAGEMTEAAVKKEAERIAAHVSESIGATPVENRRVPRRLCPKCNSANLRFKPGCLECLDCGFSNCG